MRFVDRSEREIALDTVQPDWYKEHIIVMIVAGARKHMMASVPHAP